MNIENTVTFLENLKKNNNKEWFEANRAEYTVLREDFYNLISEIQLLSSSFDKNFSIYNPKRVAYRINRDIRFSKDKSPYKSEFGALFAANKEEKENGYHFGIDAEGSLHIGGGAYLPDSQFLQKFRENLVENPEPFFEIIYNEEFDKKFGGLDRQFSLKRLPRGFEDHPDLEEILKLKGIFAYRSFSFNEIKKTELAELISSQFKLLYPLVDYLRKFA